MVDEDCENKRGEQPQEKQTVPFSMLAGGGVGAEWQKGELAGCKIPSADLFPIPQSCKYQWGF